jgi:hypothetical protein
VAGNDLGASWNEIMEIHGTRFKVVILPLWFPLDDTRDLTDGGLNPAVGIITPSDTTIHVRTTDPKYQISKTE